MEEEGEDEIDAEWLHRAGLFSEGHEFEEWVRW